MRNLEKDAAEMAARRETMLERGFELFAAGNIEGVSMQEVADACGLGVATLYRYYNTKLALVIAIGTRKWEDYFREIEALYLDRHGGEMTALEEFEFYLDCYILLYREHKDVLRFNRNFDTFVQHEGATAEQMRPYNEAVDRFVRKFHVLYQKAERDGTLRTDLPEQKLFVLSMYTMLPVAAKYAEGLVWPPGEPVDMTDALLSLKQMLLRDCRPPGAEEHGLVPAARRSAAKRPAAQKTKAQYPAASQPHHHSAARRAPAEREEYL